MFVAGVEKRRWAFPSLALPRSGERGMISAFSGTPKHFINCANINKKNESPFFINFAAGGLPHRFPETGGGKSGQGRARFCGDTAGGNLG